MKNIPIRSMPADSLDDLDDESIERTRSRLRVCDVADDVASKLSVICALLDSDSLMHLDSNDRLCADRMILDSLRECITLLRAERGL